LRRKSSEEISFAKTERTAIMRIPSNSFDAADKALCRAHGDAVANEPDHVLWARVTDTKAALTALDRKVAYHVACDAFEAVLHMPADLPLPPSYWDDLEHWLKTLAPVKPAVPQPCQAPAWRRGSDIPKNERTGLWHVRNDRYDKEPCAADDASEFWFQVAEYMPAALGAKLGDPYDESKYTAAGDAYVSAKQPEPAANVWHSEAPSVAGVYVASIACNSTRKRWFDGSYWHEDLSINDRNDRTKNEKREVEPYHSRVKWLRLIEADAPAAKPVQQVERGLGQAWSVCIKPISGYKVGHVALGRSDESTGYWRNCDADGWVTHNPLADSVCPVPSGVKAEAKWRKGLVACADQVGTWGLFSNPTCEIVAWRPTGGVA
jgi:hypothetical protein